MPILALLQVLVFYLTFLDAEPTECCVEWLDHCKCPVIYITEDMRPCGSEISLNDLNLNALWLYCPDLSEKWVSDSKIILH